LNTYIKISKTYFGKPDSVFIKNRNKKMHEYDAGIRGADCEFPEYHQGQVDPKQICHLTEASIDTMHEDLGGMDYKQYAKRGPHIGKYTRKQIAKNVVKWIAVWKWSNNNRYETLEEGKSISYEVLGYVDAKLAVSLLEPDDEGKMRFPYPPPPPLEEEDRTETIRKLESMPIDKARTTALRLMEDWNPTKIGGKASKNRTIFDIKQAFTSQNICGIMYRLQLASEGLGTFGSSWQQHYRNI